MAVNAIILDSTEASSFTDSILVFDLISEVSENYRSNVSQYPVQALKTGSRSNISDHVNITNPELSTRIAVSDNPIENVLGNRSDANEINNQGSRAAAARELLKGLYNNSTPFTLITKYESFDNCVISNLSFPRDVSTADILTADINFVQIRVVEAETVTLIDIGNLTYTAETPKIIPVEDSPWVEIFSLINTGVVGASGTTAIQELFNPEN